jgi:hypothetical protein
LVDGRRLVVFEVLAAHVNSGFNLNDWVAWVVLRGKGGGIAEVRGDSERATRWEGG